MTTASRQLLAFTFPSGSSFEGNLVGALERIESGGAMRLLDGLFVARQPDSGELVAVSMSSGSRSGMIGKLISFRLDDSARRTATEHALSGPSGEAVQSLAGTLEPGEAIAALLVEHTWALVLGEAIGRMGGEEMASEFVGVSEGSELWSQLAAARSS